MRKKLKRNYSSRINWREILLKQGSKYIIVRISKDFSSGHLKSMKTVHFVVHRKTTRRNLVKKPTFFERYFHFFQCMRSEVNRSSTKTRDCRFVTIWRKIWVPLLLRVLTINKKPVSKGSFLTKFRWVVFRRIKN